MHVASSMLRHPRFLPRPPYALVPLALLLAACAGDAEPERQAGDIAPDSAAAVAASNAPGIAVEGFSGPESALHDERADVYLVSNLDGVPDARDGNGFISRVSPEGEILELRWIDGGSEGVTLNAPKGMAFNGDTLVVSDIDVVRLFDRGSGEPLGQWPVDGASFLNDVTVGSDGTVYVSDMGVRFEGGGRVDTGTTAVHAFGRDGSRRTLQTGDLAQINGLAAADGRLYGVTNGTGRIFMIEGGALTELPELPGLRLDGIVVTPDGLLISDWDTETVYLLRDNGSIATIARNIPSPADIGIDRKRGRVLIPSLMTNRLLLAPIPDVQP